MPLENPFFHFSLPYTFHHIENPHVKNLWLPLNRNYKPLGYASRDHVRYEDFYEQALVFARPLSSDEKFWWVSGDRTCSYHLYNDDPVSRETYWTRLTMLMRRKHFVVSSCRARGPHVLDQESFMALVRWSASLAHAPA